MTDFEEHLWSHLVAEHDAARVLARDLSRGQPRRGPLLLGGATLGAVAVAAATLALTATTATPKAYALTRNSDGSYTLTMHDAATAIPQVNAEFAKLGIPAKAIPVTPTCTAPPGGLSLLSPGGVSMSYSVTFSKEVPAGWTDFIAVEQTPAGVRETYGSSSQPLPACLSSSQAPPVTVDPITSTTTGDMRATPRSARERSERGR